MAKRTVSKKSSQAIAPFPFQLIDIRLYDVIVERCNSADETSERVPISIGLASFDDEDDSFRIHLAFDASFPIDKAPLCRIHLSIEGKFQPIVDISTLNPDVITKFKENDSIVLFWPYLRQMLHDLTNRMRLSIPPLPVIDPRTLVQTNDESDEQFPKTT
jgi:preprotein translocase subunit SecB